jgi:hypothetical protein
VYTLYMKSFSRSIMVTPVFLRMRKGEVFTVCGTMKMNVIYTRIYLLFFEVGTRWSCVVIFML